ncbi:MAG: exosortase/archaeosortase family protein [Candidatus Micrarchaeota archaeon]|nr:exosortase/archaeosortase family protein [Candidatus Micrarchaeota archaeon]
MKFHFTPEQRRLLSVLIFLAKMIALSVPIYIVLFFNIPLHPLQEAVIGQSVAIFNAAGYEAVREGYLIRVNNDFTFGISEDCTPWKSIWLLFALMIAVPRIAWKRRVIGMVAGAFALWAANLARIFFIVYVQQLFGSPAAMFVHDYLWKALLVVVVLGIWVAWLSWNGRIDKSY